jgi:oligoribonuclease
MKFISIDIETTGLDPNTDQILQFAACIGDTNMQPLEHAKEYINIYVIPKDPIVVPLRVAAMHGELFRALVKYSGELGNDKQVVKINDHLFAVKPEKLLCIFRAWMKKLYPNNEKANVAGKNFSGFDMKFLERNSPDWDFMFRHRVIDPGVLYWRTGDAKVPSTETCLGRMCETYSEVKPENIKAHDALEDAQLVMWLVCAKLKG